MQPLLASGAPTSFPDQLALAVTALILVFPAACLLAALLQPAPLSARALEIFHTATRWCRYALGLAIFGIAMVELSMLLQGYDIYDDLSSHVFWVHPHLGTGTVSLLLILGCHLLRRKASPLPHSQTLAAPPTFVTPYKAWALLFIIALGAALLFHRHPLFHLPVAIWAIIVIITASVIAAGDFLAPLPALTDPAHPSTHASTLWRTLSRTLLVAVPSVLTLALTIAASLGLARWQEHLARRHGDHLVSQLEEITHHCTQHYPAALPHAPEFIAPWYLTVSVTYLPDDSRRGYRLSHPLALHPGAQMRRDTHSPNWYWWGSSDW